MHIIAGLYRNRKLIAPKRDQTRPTAGRLREALFSICQNYIQDVRFLDLCAGSGCIGLEALSRGAGFSTFIEHNREAVEAIRQNIKSLDVQNQTQILQGDIFKMLDLLKKKGESFDIIYADPPYHTTAQAKNGLIPISEKLIEYIDGSALLSPNGILFIEESFDHQPSLADLKTLALKKSRKVSCAILQEYERKKILSPS
jgi:16S rRNA (guanine(966)-N(2))-methyltransferase RsmD